MTTNDARQDGEIYHEECAECGGIVDSNQPGHYKSPSEVFVHAVCREEGKPSCVLDISDEHPFKAQIGTQYGCGHYAHGPQMELPDECPECEVSAP